jgi:hypothetical protein
MYWYINVLLSTLGGTLATVDVYTDSAEFILMHIMHVQDFYGLPSILTITARQLSYVYFKLL